MNTIYHIFDLGLVDYAKSLDFQKEIFRRVKNGEFKAVLIFCSHDPVITLGRSSGKNNILAGSAELKSKGIKTYAIERGGDVTYHGPGQLMVYPVFNLAYFKKDIHFFLRKLEDTAIAALKAFDIKGERIKGKTGVWVGAEKIASIGIAVRQWISFHGMAINVKKSDLDNFALIKPCGMDIMMTSMETVSCKDIEIDAVKEIIVREGLI
jgi:lipoyl(octanoyl) transferase